MNIFSNKKLILAFFSLLLLNSFLAFSQSTFSGLDLNSENGLLFTEEKSVSSYTNHKNLYFAELEKSANTKADSLSNKLIINQAGKNPPKLLTCYPEQLNILLGGKLLEIQNSEGKAQYSVSENKLTWVEENPINKIRAISPKTQTSPNGEWITYYEKTSPARGNVILENISTKKTLTLAKNVEYSFESIPVKWAPDSSFLIYENNNNLYFLDMKEIFNSTNLSENYRKIGSGTINSIHWSNAKQLIYINYDMVYKIATNELYTRSLYADMVGTGKIAGRLPTPINSSKDRFWTDSTGSKIILVQNNKTLWYIELNGIDRTLSKPLVSYPFITIPTGVTNFHIFWTPEDKGFQLPLVWLEVYESGKKNSYLYKLASSSEQNNSYFQQLTLPPYVHSPKLSPDGKALAFIDEKALHIYDIFTWKQNAFFANEKVVSYQWIDKKALYVGGTETISYWEPYTDKFIVLLLSQSNKYAFDGETGKILAENSHGVFAYNEENNIWEKSEAIISRKATTQNPYWRVFLGESKNRFFENGIYVRTLTGLSETRPLYVDYISTVTNQPKIALVFDALDNADGITYILDILERFNLKATFFINGEFIRRYPNYVTEIVKFGHECASMFFTTADLTNSSYVVDESFIRRGLARTEDEFYALTGKELSLYWHTPYYKTTEAIIKGGRDAGYTLVRPTTKQLDLQTLEDTAKNSTTYYSSAKIIEGIFSVLKDKAVIPISVGLSKGTRTDYLYNKIDVLISAILEDGYEIVKVSDL